MRLFLNTESLNHNYEKNMASGRVQYSEDYESPSWTYSVPGSAGDLINEYELIN